jgi:hypothetical protein
MKSPTAFITVTCDVCKTEVQVELTTTARGYDERNVDETLESLGWSVGTFELCPDCAEELIYEEPKEEE